MRQAVAQGIRSLGDYDISSVDVATDGCTVAVSESAHLTVWNYKDEKRNKMPSVFNVLNGGKRLELRAWTLLITRCGLDPF